MTAREVMTDIEREFESYRADSISNGAEDVWDRLSCEIYNLDDSAMLVAHIV